MYKMDTFIRHALTMVVLASYVSSQSIGIYTSRGNRGGSGGQFTSDVQPYESRSRWFPSYQVVRPMRYQYPIVRRSQQAFSQSQQPTTLYRAPSRQYPTRFRYVQTRDNAQWRTRQPALWARQPSARFSQPQRRSSSIPLRTVRVIPRRRTEYDYQTRWQRALPILRSRPVIFKSQRRRQPSRVFVSNPIRQAFPSFQTPVMAQFRTVDIPRSRSQNLPFRSSFSITSLDGDNEAHSTGSRIAISGGGRIHITDGNHGSVQISQIGADTGTAGRTTIISSPGSGVTVEGTGMAHEINANGFKVSVGQKASIDKPNDPLVGRQENVIPSAVQHSTTKAHMLFNSFINNANGAYPAYQFPSFVDRDLPDGPESPEAPEAPEAPDSTGTDITIASTSDSTADANTIAIDTLETTVSVTDAVVNANDGIVLDTQSKSSVVSTNPVVVSLDNAAMAPPAIDSFIAAIKSGHVTSSIGGMSTLIDKSPVLDTAIVDTKTITDIVLKPILAPVADAPIIDTIVKATPVINIASKSLPAIDATATGPAVLDTAIVDTKTITDTVLKPILAQVADAQIIDTIVKATPVKNIASKSLPAIDATATGPAITEPLVV